MSKPFRTEKQLTHTVVNSPALDDLLGHSTWERWDALEVEGFFGVPDLLVGLAKRNQSGRRVTKAFAFEMKLSAWRRALVQAYRYGAFADYSFVVMDAHYVKRALAHLTKFERANVGLASAHRSGALTVHYRPKRRQPYSAQLRGRLRKEIMADMFD